jgi:hypothetical protein
MFKFIFFNLGFNAVSSLFSSILYSYTCLHACIVDKKLPVDNMEACLNAHLKFVQGYLTWLSV